MSSPATQEVRAASLQPVAFAARTPLRLLEDRPRNPQAFRSYLFNVGMEMHLGKSSGGSSPKEVSDFYGRLLADRLQKDASPIKKTDDVLQMKVETTGKENPSSPARRREFSQFGRKGLLILEKIAPVIVQAFF